jgi:hypothetical protein
MLFDYVYEKIVSNLRATSDALPPEDRFLVYPDYYRNVLPAKGGNHVFVYMGNQNPAQNQNAGSRNYYQFETEYVLDLLHLAEAKYNRTTNLMSDADRLAGIKLRRLLAIVVNSVYHYLNNDFLSLDDPTVTSGELAITNYPRVESFFPSEPLPGEKALVGLRVTIPVDMVFVPTGNPGEILDSVFVQNTGQNPHANEVDYDP